MRHLHPVGIDGVVRDLVTSALRYLVPLVLVACAGRAPGPPSAAPDAAPPSVPASPAAAPSAPASPPAPVGPSAIRLLPARVLDVDAGSYLPEGTEVVVEGGAIVRVGPPKHTSSGAQVIRLDDLTLIPGLIDLHTHLLHETDALARRESEDMVREALQMSDAHRVLLGAKHAREMLQAGFTTVRDVGNCGPDLDVDLRRGVAQGWIEGPAMHVSTRALAPVGGQFHPGADPAVVEHEYRTVSGVEDARREVRDALAAGADGIKVIVGSETTITLTAPEVKAIVDEAHRADRWVAAHCTDDAAARIAIDAGVDSIEHGYDLEDATLARMAEEKIVLVPTDVPLGMFEWLLQVNPHVPDDPTPLRERMADARRKAVARLRRARAANVPFAFGSDAYYPWAEHTRGDVARETLVAYADAGLSAADVIRAATASAADVLHEETGRVAEGKQADLVAVAGDVLADLGSLAAVHFVMSDGTIARAPAAEPTP